MAKASKTPKRDDDLSGKKDVEEDCLELFKSIDNGFQAQRDRSDDIIDGWGLYNCEESDKQFYNGTSRLSLPFIHDAVEAKVQRYANQLFPVSGRYVEVTTGEADPPQATQALLETYVRKAKLRTEVVPALLRNGQLEGTYLIYADWTKTTRFVVSRTEEQPKTDGMINEAAEPVLTVGPEEELIDAYPSVEVLSDNDTLILPAASNSIADALNNGGSVTVLRRWSKGKIKKLIKNKDIDKEKGETLLEEMTKAKATQDKDTAKDQLDTAGIKERGKYALVYEIWTKLQIHPWNEPRLCRIYMGGEESVLSVKRCPYWSDRCPVIGVPIAKKASVFKVQPPTKVCNDLQIFANDTINEGADTAHFSAMPIVMTDPVKNPRVETMTLALAAIWETNPNDTQIVEFPELWKSCLERAGSLKDQIFQTLGVNPAMVPGSTGSPGKKRNQAEMAVEQQVDLLNTADAATILEEGILTPLIQFFAELDQQFRDEEITIRTYGEMGLNANMERVPPLQLNNRFEFRWFGLESARSAGQMQQQISWLNVVKGIPPQQYPGYELDASPMLVQGTENVFGPRTAPLIFKKKKFITVDPMLENEMLIEGFPVSVHPADDDAMHMQAHMMLMQEGDPHGNVQAHMMAHMQQAQAKAMQQQQPQQGGGPGAPGGAQQPPGPREGAQAQAPGGAQQPPGAVHKDQQPAKLGVVNMPRK